MSEKLKILYYGLWFAHPVLQSVIAIAMYRRGQHRAFNLRRGLFELQIRL